MYGASRVSKYGFLLLEFYLLIQLHSSTIIQGSLPLPYRNLGHVVYCVMIDVPGNIGEYVFLHVALSPVVAWLLVGFS